MAWQVPEKFRADIYTILKSLVNMNANAISLYCALTLKDSKLYICRHTVHQICLNHISHMTCCWCTASLISTWIFISDKIFLFYTFVYTYFTFWTLSIPLTNARYQTTEYYVSPDIHFINQHLHLKIPFFSFFFLTIIQPKIGGYYSFAHS